MSNESPLHIFGAQLVLLWRTLKAARREGIVWKEVLRHMAELGTSSAALIFMGLFFFGVVLVTIAWAQVRKYFGNIAVIGPPYFQLILREFSPIMAAILAASRQGASTAAEIGAMSVNEQVEALELSAADPLAELVAPRLIASILVLPLLTTIGVIAATTSAAATVTFGFQNNGMAFLDPSLVTKADLISVLIKTIACGAFIPIAASLRGLRAKGGAAAVGEAVTVGVVEACMGCLVIDFVIAAAYFVIAAHSA